MANKKILIIEDNEINIYLETYLLENASYEVYQAKSGEEGLKQAEAIQPNLILLDIQLPGMDGYEVADRLKKSNRTSQIPIVAVTSFAMAGDKEKILATGCEGYLSKPIDPDTFVESITPFIH